MGIFELASGLKGEYRDAYDRIEIYAETMHMNETLAEEMMMNLIDSLLNAQTEGVPVEKIVGTDIKQFCKDYFTVYGRKEWLGDFLKTIYELAWIVFIFELVGIFLSEEPFSIGMKAEVLGYLLGVAIWIPFIILEPLVVRPLVYKVKKVNATIYAVGRFIVFIVLLVGAILLSPDVGIEVPLLSLLLPAGIYIVVYMIMRAVWRYQRTGTIGKSKESKLQKRKEKEIKRDAENQSLIKGYVEGSIQRFDRINKRLLRKGKEPMSEEQFMEKLYRERKINEKYEKPGNVITAVLMGIVLICSIPRESWVDAIIFLGVFTVYGFLVLKFIYSVSARVWEQQRRVLDECRERGITIFEYEQDIQDIELE